MSGFKYLPAIDIIDGKCVRLIQGDYEQKTIYSDDPISTAQKWQDQGGHIIHLVDLDGAKAKHPVNTELIKNICKSIKIPCEVGGGIRTIEAIKELLDIGVSRVILGTAAIKDPEFTIKALTMFKEQIVLGVDAKNGKVAIEGWIESSKLNAIDIVKQYTLYGLKRVIYTDINKDGMLQGPNIESTLKLAIDSGVKIIASGGISSNDDILNLRKFYKEGIEGCIIGKALYTNKVDLMSLP